MNKVRTRFAPSPTGYLHCGGLRNALYSYLFAKQNNGSFILRIEDTDQTRLTPNSIENIIDSLNWAGLDFDEGPGKGGEFGPYIQSERLDIYKKHAQDLIKNEHAYYCFCSKERLEQVRQQQMASKLPPAYDKHCRNLPKEEVHKKLENNTPYVIRMKVPLEGELTFSDIVRGQVTIAYQNVDDQVLLKSDGFPTYHLAVVVDDHLMQISHVMRGEEWLPSTPKHILLYKYFGWELPLFAHFPLLLNTDRSKLSKRQGDVSVEDYKLKGYLPEALINFVAFLGWNPGEGDTREIFSLSELIKEFSLKHVGKSGAVFNIEKLQWLNQQYFHKKPADEILLLIKPLLKEKGWETKSDNYIKQVIELLRERVTLTQDFVENGAYFFQEPMSYDEKSKTKNWKPETGKYLIELAKQFEDISEFNSTTIEKTLRDYAQKIGISASNLIHPLRLALTGVGQGPSLFHLAEVLGKDSVLKRIHAACNILN